MRTANVSEDVGSTTGRVLAAAPGCASMVAIILVWAAISRLELVPAFVLPGPGQVGLSAREHGVALARATMDTATSAIAGFTLAATIAVTLSILAVSARWVHRAIMPLATLMQATPVVAVAPLLAVWFGTGFAAKVALSALIAFFPILVSGTTGLTSTPSALLDVMTAYRATYWQRLSKALLPHAAPQIFAGLRVGATLSVVGSIVAELIVADRGIGRHLMLGVYYLDVPRIFAAVMCSAGLGLLFFAVIVGIQQFVRPARPVLRR